MESFLLIAILCTDSNVCQSYVLDHSITQDYCDSYFTDSGVNQVDKLITDIIEFDIKQPVRLQSVECVIEDME
jgi:hypothetical protein